MGLLTNKRNPMRKLFIRPLVLALCLSAAAQALRALDCFQDQGFLTELSQSLVRRDH